MRTTRVMRAGALAGLILAVAGCSQGGLFDRAGDFFTGGPSENPQTGQSGVFEESRSQRRGAARDGSSSLLDLFTNADDPNITLEVNRYIWVAAQDILDFMPIQTVDPFSGIIVYGYGTPPGSSRAYRATVYVQDPALDARSLRVALATRSGPAPAQTVRAIEDAILTRARQLRIADGKL